MIADADPSSATQSQAPEQPSCPAVGQGDYVVQSGDTLSSIAEAHGHFWQTLWNDPANAALKAARSNPEILQPGDRLTIQPIRVKTVRALTGRVHRFRRRGVPVRVIFAIWDQKGTPLSGKKYQLSVGSSAYEGTTDSEGLLKEWVAPAAKTGQLVVWPGMPELPETVEWTIRIGYLNPVESISGAQARLNNLRFDCGSEDGVLGPRTQAALQAFQAKHGLPPTGDYDAETCAKLKEVYGI